MKLIKTFTKKIFKTPILNVITNYLGKCDKCGKKETKTNEFKICSKCKVNRYCSIECQTKDWKMIIKQNV